MKLTLTNHSGVSSSMEFADKKTVELFIEKLPNTLKQNQRVKITCDLLGISGWVSGKSI